MGRCSLVGAGPWGVEVGVGEGPGIRGVAVGVGVAEEKKSV